MKSLSPTPPLLISSAPNPASATDSQRISREPSGGVSDVSFLKGGPAPKRDYFYWELHEGPHIQAIRFGDWKAVRNGPDKPVELYDLKADPGEKTDLAARHPDLVTKAVALMKAARTDDPNWPMVPAVRRAGPAKKNAPAKSTKGSPRN